MSTFHANGIVLRTMTTGEHDRRARIYTEDYGKLDVFVKSARRLQSKLSPHLEPFILADCYIVRGRIDHLAGIERQDRFFGFRQSLDRLGAAAWAAELVDELTKPDHADPRIFRLLLAWFSFLENTNHGVPDRARLSYLIHLLGYLGYAPVFEHCVFCKSEESSVWCFVNREGGVVCTRCDAKQDGVEMREAERLVCAELRTVARPLFTLESYRSISEKTALSLTTSLLVEHLDRPLHADIFLVGINNTTSVSTMF